MVARWMGWTLADVRALDIHEHRVLVEMMTEASQPRT